MSNAIQQASAHFSVPIHVTARGVPAGVSLHEFIQRRFVYALGRFAPRLRDAQVWLEDVNGPRGGIDKRCRIELRERPRGRVIVTAEAANEYAAVTRAVRRCAVVLDRSKKRRWTLRNQRAKRAMQV